MRRQITSGTNVRDADGEVDLAILVFRDVTELRRLERQRDEYLALISHDLRGPLNTIVLSAGLLKNAREESEPLDTASIIDRLARNAQRMNTMIAELLECTTLESEVVNLRKEPCDIGEIVNGVIGDLDDESGRRVVLEVVETSPSHVFAEASQIARAVTNLITNALKYSPDDSPVRVLLMRKGESIVIEVRDHGIGIASTHLPRLFERYYRAPTGTRVSGLGLGLYITGLIVEANGGRIDVVSEVGKGSTFRLFLPLHVAEK